MRDSELGKRNETVKEELEPDLTNLVSWFDLEATKGFAQTSCWTEAACPLTVRGIVKRFAGTGRQ